MSARTGAAVIALAGSAAVIASGIAGLQGCAHVAMPPGGPPDSTPPLLVAVVPESLSVNPGFDDEVRFEFDEPISERNIQTSTILYPLELRPKIGKGKRELRVKPREGWVEDRIYHVRVDPVIQDLFNNTIREPLHYVFSTGMIIPENVVEGYVFDRITAQPLREGRVDMVHLPDTLRYGTVADTSGSFQLSTLPPGDYLAIGYEDINGNRKADEFDRSDTARVSLDPEEALSLEFNVFRHDTVGPVLAGVTVVDSMVLELEFDGYLDPEAPLPTADARVFALQDSSPVGIDTVMHAWQYTIWRDSVDAVRRARADSLAALEAAAADTIAAPDSAAVEPPPAPPPPRPQREPEEGQEEEEPQEPIALPDRRIYVVTDTRIPVGTHIVSVRNVMNLSGFAGGGQLEFEPLAPEPEEEPPEGPPPGRG
jgi:hypothetical protein